MKLLLISAVLLGLASATFVHHKKPHIIKTYKWVKVPKLEIVKPDFGIKAKVIAGKEKTLALLSSLVSHKVKHVQPVTHEKKIVVYPAWKIHKYKGIEIRPVQIVHHKHEVIQQYAPQYNEHLTTQVHPAPPTHYAVPQVQIPSTHYGVPEVPAPPRVPSTYYGVPEVSIPPRVPSTYYGVPEVSTPPRVPSTHYGVPEGPIPPRVPSTYYGFPEVSTPPRVPSTYYGVPEGPTPPRVPSTYYGVPEVQVPPKVPQLPQQEYGVPIQNELPTSYQVVNHGILAPFQAPHYTVYAPQYDTRSSTDDIPQYEPEKPVHQPGQEAPKWEPIYVPDQDPTKNSGVQQMLDTLESLPEVPDVTVPQLPETAPASIYPALTQGLINFNYESYPPYHHQQLRNSYGDVIPEASYSPSENVEVVVPAPKQDLNNEERQGAETSETDELGNEEAPAGEQTLQPSAATQSPIQP